MPHRPKLIVALINVSLIVASLVVAKGRAPTPNNDLNAIIDVCKLVKDPSQYAGKTIRLKAVLVENRTSRVEGATLIYMVLVAGDLVSVLWWSSPPKKVINRSRGSNLMSTAMFV